MSALYYASFDFQRAGGVRPRESNDINRGPSEASEAISLINISCMGELIFVNIGHAGVRIGETCW